MNTGVSTVREAREQSTWERFVARHTLLVLGLGIAALAGAVLVVLPEVGSWGWGVLGGALGAALVGVVWLDRPIAVVRLWSGMCADSGLVARGSGVPGLMVLRPGWRSLVVSMGRAGLTPHELRECVERLGIASPYDRARVVKVSRSRCRVRFDCGMSALEGDSRLPAEVTGEGVLIGLDEDRERVYLPLSGVSGALVGGLPGSGKTFFLRRLVASLGGKKGYGVVVLDGKGTNDFDDLVTSPFVRLEKGSPDVEPGVLSALEAVEKEMNARAQGAGNRRKLILIVDEVQGFTDTSGLTGAEKKTIEKSAAIIRRLVQKGRSLDIFVILATQKPDATTIPTKIRDNLGIALCFNVRTAETGKTVLGENGAEAVGLPVGVAVLDTGKNRKKIRIAKL